MVESPPEYTVRDYSAVDKQIEEVARREKTLTDRMRIQNLAKLAIMMRINASNWSFIRTNKLGYSNNERST